jgi:CHAD domain-containing protein
MARAWDVPGLRRDARFRDAAGRVILTRWREMMSYRGGTLAGEDIEELHAMRVSSRRLRAAMDAFAGAFPPRSFRTRLRAVKEITDTLGAARDLDVAIEGLTAILDDFDPSERVGVEALIGEYRTRRAAEAEHIAALFTRIERERYGRSFERWVARHTGVDAKRLDPRPPAA